MNKKRQSSQLEFVALMASLMAIVALTIDALLPALTNIGISIGNTNSTDHQLLITLIFLGLGLGQLIFGPLSDSFGRKPIVYIGFIIFLIASVICISAQSLEVMLLGRCLQGVGLSAPRTISISIIRDCYKGDRMAKIMSFVTVIFILVPIIAPTLGMLMLEYYDWKSIFYIQILFALVVVIWFWKRQEETLKPKMKIPFSYHVFIDGVKEILKFKDALGFTIITGLITGAFMVYLSASQHIFQSQYGLVKEFPLIFAGLAGSVGLATFLNGTLVMKLGMRNLSFYALIAYTFVALAYVGLFYNGINPSLFVLITFLVISFFSLGFLFGNLRAIAMQPIGHIAGIGAAITGFVSTIIAVPIGTYIGTYVISSALPLFIGFFVCGILSLVLFTWLGRVQK
ncbi:MAG: Bcr/CflA family drug resistance efflux transporter [Bacteroidetes bacterium MedPE-SWsnd-G2]|nr:MAG: Bcr/CflA family drug resistance efflux transporter [Bacteroidetes bacterium MedPE-SWsnd-G2]